MSISATWAIPGAEELPIYGNTHVPETGHPRGVAIVVHGYTGHKSRNIIPGVSTYLGDEANMLVHRLTLSHAGIARDGDQITEMEVFERDSNAFCVEDVRRVVEDIDAGTLPGKGLPLVLVGHSRGGATIYRCAAHAETEAWPIRASALISLGATATFTRITEDILRQLEEKGYVERECSRAPGGFVRLGRSWYAHHLDHPGRDLFAEAVAEVRCPVLIAHGSEDASVEPEHAAEIAATFKAHNPHVTPRLLMVEGADHNFNVSGSPPEPGVMFNPAARVVYDAIGAFLDDVL